jgi:glutamyl-tRNA reductase
MFKGHAACSRAKGLAKGARVLVCVGLNQKRAAVADRDSIAARDGGIDSAPAEYAALDAIDEVAVLSTCCGVEVYATTGCAAAATLSLRRALEARAGRELPLFELNGADAFRRLVRAAAGLESAVVGEPRMPG